MNNDTVYTASEETWAVPTDEINISGYKAVARVDCTGSARRACGARCLASQRLLGDNRNPSSIRTGENEDRVDVTVLKLRNLLIAGAYANPAKCQL
ncbi:unnamed protein product [Gongylonema pulchrum]|uniref:Uncharacterized protein n=1 Tax=Gongylonema pulchrum TaxID=637853 RepID=A0A183ER48_9BILA|nr:unnamed protein product [Gongylonema pulchrum]